MRSRSAEKEDKQRTCLNVGVVCEVKKGKRNKRRKRKKEKKKEVRRTSQRSVAVKERIALTPERNVVWDKPVEPKKRRGVPRQF
jgi:hypothetical protein